MALEYAMTSVILPVCIIAQVIGSTSLSVTSLPSVFAASASVLAIETLMTVRNASRIAELSMGSFAVSTE